MMAPSAAVVGLSVSSCPPSGCWPVQLALRWLLSEWYMSKIEPATSSDTLLGRGGAPSRLSFMSADGVCVIRGGVGGSDLAGVP